MAVDYTQYLSAANLTSPGEFPRTPWEEPVEYGGAASVQEVSREVEKACPSQNSLHVFLHPYYTQLGGLGSFAAGLTSLKVIRCRIRSLSGLETCKNLRFLWLDDNMLTDVDLLASLPKLELVSLSDNRITTESIARLAPTGIRALNLSGNNIVSCNWVQKHKHLEFLDLSRTRIAYFQLEVTISRTLRALDLSASRIASTAVLRTLLVRTFPNLRCLTLRSRAGDCPFVGNLTDSGYLASVFYLVVQNNLPLEALDGKFYSPREVVSSSGLVRSAPEHFRYCIQRETIAQSLRTWQRYALERLGGGLLALQKKYFGLKTDLQDLALLLSCQQVSPAVSTRPGERSGGVVGSNADMKKASALRGEFSRVCGCVSGLAACFHSHLAAISQALYMHDQVLLGEFLSFGGISISGMGSELPLDLFSDEAMRQALSYYAVGGQLRAFVKRVCNRSLSQLYERRFSEMLELGDRRIVPCGKELYEALLESAGGEAGPASGDARAGRDKFVLVKVNGDKITQLFGPDIQAETGVMALTALVRPSAIPAQLESLPAGSVLSYLALRVCSDTLASGVLDARAASFEPVFTVAFVRPADVASFAAAWDFVDSFRPTPPERPDSSASLSSEDPGARLASSGQSGQGRAGSAAGTGEQSRRSQRWFPADKAEYVIAEETLAMVTEAEGLLAKLVPEPEAASLKAALSPVASGPGESAGGERAERARGSADAPVPMIPGPVRCGDLLFDFDIAKQAIEALQAEFHSSLHPLVNLIPSLGAADFEKVIAERIALTTSESSAIACLDLHNCGLEGDIHNLLDQFEGLRSLSLASNSLTSLEIHQQSLQQLDISGNKIESCFIDSPALELLDVSWNAFATPDTLLRCLSAKAKGALIHLVVFGNPFCSNPLDFSWASTLSRYLPQLRTINGLHLRRLVAWDKVCCPETLLYNLFADPSPEAEGRDSQGPPGFCLDSLLDLPQRVLTSALPFAKEISRLSPSPPALGAKLDLSFTGLLEVPRDVLAKGASQITDVSLRSCFFPRFGALAAFPEVQSLNLSGCRVTTDVLTEILASAQKLQFLDVSRNLLDSLAPLAVCSKTLIGLNASSNVRLDINTLPDLPALSFLSICDIASDQSLAAVTVSTRCPHLTHLQLDLPELASDRFQAGRSAGEGPTSSAPPALPSALPAGQSAPPLPQPRHGRRSSSATSSTASAQPRSSSRPLSLYEDAPAGAAPLDSLDAIPPVLFLLPLVQVNSVSVNPIALNKRRFTFIGNVNMNLLRSCKCLSRSAKLESASRSREDSFPSEGLRPQREQSSPSPRKKGVSEEILKAFPPRTSVPYDVLTLTSLNLQSLAYEQQAEKAVSHVTTIFAGHNSLTSLAPLRDYPALIQIDVRDNQIAAPFENLCSETLEALNLTANPIQSLRVSGSLVPNLRCLILRKSGLTILPANFLSAIGKSLVYLDISENPFQDLSKSCLGGLASLHILKCEECGLRSLEFLDVLASYDCLQTLDIRGNKIQNAERAFSSLRRQKALVRLLAADNPFTMREKELADRRFKVFAEVPQVEELDGTPRTAAEQKRLVEYAKRNMEYAREHQPSILNFTMGSPTAPQPSYSVTPSRGDEPSSSPRYRSTAGERRAGQPPRPAVGPQRPSHPPTQLSTPQFSGGLYPTLPPVASRSKTPGDSRVPDRAEKGESSSRGSQRSARSAKQSVDSGDHMPELPGARRARRD